MGKQMSDGIHRLTYCKQKQNYYRSGDQSKIGISTQYRYSKILKNNKSVNIYE